MSWAEKLARERRARLAAERLLEQKQRELLAAHQQLEIHARSLSEQIVEQREVVQSALSEAEQIKGKHSRVLCDLEQAHVTAVMAERRLWDSIEAIRDGFAVFDQHQRLIGANRAYRAAFPEPERIAPGIEYAQILKICAHDGLVELDAEAPEDWVRRMLERWKGERIEPAVIRFREGPWVKLIDRRARDGDLVSVALNITETIEREAEMAQARARAEAASRAKSAFLANMSHEIRTPMNGVVGMAEMLCESGLSEEQRLYAETIRSSGEALLAIINDVMDYSKIEAQKLRLAPEPFDLERCIHEVIMMLQPGATARGIELMIDFDIFLPTLFHGDPGRMRQILTNLVGNAVKFTEAGHVMVRVVGVEAGGDGWQLHVTVEDTGIGIKAGHLEHVFGEFNQVEDQSNRSFDGAGLGLAITRRLIDLMEGEMWVESQPGKGSCFGFRVTLPSAEEAPRTDPSLAIAFRSAMVIDTQLINRDILERQLRAVGLEVRAYRGGAEALAALDGGSAADVALIDHETGEMDGLALAERMRAAGWPGTMILMSAKPARAREDARAGCFSAIIQKPVLRRDLLARLGELGAPALEHHVPSEAEPDLPRQMRVLSAEDNKTNRLVLSKMLKHLDIELAFAEDGNEAVEMHRAFRPDLILMDISMPGMDGREAARAIRALEAEAGAPATPIIALTAHASDGDGDWLASDGIDSCLAKPLRRKAITERVLAHVPHGVRPPMPEDDAAHPFPATGRTAAQAAEATSQMRG